LSEPAPYFVQAVFRFLSENNISVESGLRIFTTLDVEAQEIAQRAVIAHVANLEANNKAVAKIKLEKKKNLEAAFIAVDLDTGGISALVGGRKYQQTQYNRILDGHRQVGSVMKPFVYLAAFEGRRPDGSPYEATTLIDDIPFTYSYEGQKWSPKNYTKEHYGSVPMFYALKNSLNMSTAKLGLEVGLDNIIDVARRAGVTSEMKPFPSLTLGAFEIRAYEVAQAYATIARFGLRKTLHSVTLVENLNGDEIFTFNTEPEAEISPTAAAVLIGVMKENLLTGTGRLALLRGFTRPAAGKTGTTSDAKDTWYAGFTPSTLAVAWTGYDDNTPSGLTGASGALPLWVDFMKPFTEREPIGDFKWPEGVELRKFSAEEMRKMLPANAADYEIKETELIFTN
jgi:penicillin-binding protein 1B